MLVQKAPLVRCRLELQVIVVASQEESAKDARLVVLHAQVLQALGISISISLRADRTDCELFLPVLQQLAPHLQEVDHWTLPARQQLAAKNSRDRNDFSVAHYTSLQASSPGLHTLCASSSNSGLALAQLEASNTQILTSIAAFSSLTKLHLTLLGAVMQPLAQLSSLQDLALQAQSQHSASCAAVTDNNRHTLCSVVLSAESWTPETYHSLHFVLGIETVAIDIIELDSTAMPYLAGISARLLRLIIRGAVDSVTVEALNVAKVHSLTLRCVSDSFWQQMAGSTSLQKLTLVDVGVLSGEVVPAFPHLTKLTLINCHRVCETSINHWLSKSAPALASLTFC